MSQSVKTKAAVLLCLAHLGLLVSLGALISARTDLALPQLLGLLAGVLLMYAAVMFGVLAIWLPLRPWLARYERAASWKTWIVDELPTFLALIPVLVTALKILSNSWDAIKKHHESGDLNVGSLGTVAAQFALDAEKLKNDPAITLARDKLKGRS